MSLPLVIPHQAHSLSAAIHSLVASALLFITPSLAMAADSVVVFNEVHYHPENDDSSLEYIELYNQLAIEVDLSNWRH